MLSQVISLARRSKKLNVRVLRPTKPSPLRHLHIEELQKDKDGMVVATIKYVNNLPIFT
jgi:hypothetical protein